MATHVSVIAFIKFSVQLLKGGETSEVGENY